MHERDNRRDCAVDHEERAERKSIEDRASDMKRDQRELEQPLLNPPECMPNRVKKLRTEPRPFGLVPNSRFEDVELRFRPNAQFVYLGAERAGALRGDPGPRSTAWLLRERPGVRPAVRRASDAAT